VAGKQDHKVDNEAMIDHIVDLVEDRARTLREARETAKG
jgi:(E)-4-hydroxy-3-methylbut-2-enyl-diphosphate synthase